MTEKIKNEILEKLEIDKEYYKLYDYFLSDCVYDNKEDITCWLHDVVIDGHNFSNFCYIQPVNDFVNVFRDDIYKYLLNNYDFLPSFSAIQCLDIEYVYEQIGIIIIEALASEIYGVI